MLLVKRLGKFFNNSEKYSNRAKRNKFFKKRILSHQMSHAMNMERNDK